MLVATSFFVFQVNNDSSSAKQYDAATDRTGWSCVRPAAAAAAA